MAIAISTLFKPGEPSFQAPGAAWGAAGRAGCGSSQAEVPCLGEGTAGPPIPAVLLDLWAGATPAKGTAGREFPCSSGKTALQNQQGTRSGEEIL